LNVAGGATAEINGNDWQVDALTGGGTVQLNYVNAHNITVGTNNGSGTFAGVINEGSGAGSYALSFTKIGTGVQSFTGTNTYHGATTVNGGTLRVDGAISRSAVTVANGTLAGNGLILGATAIQLNGTLQPGSGGTNTGTLTISNNLTLAGNALFVLNRTNAQNSSRVVGVTNVTYGGTLTVTNAGPALQAGDAFTLFQATNYSGTFTNLALPNIAPLVWDTSSLAVSGRLVAKAPITLALASIPGGDIGYRSTVTFTASVQTNGVLAGNATNNVTFTYQINGVPFLTNTMAAVNGSAADTPVSLPRGTNLVAVVYAGDGNYLPGTTTLTQVVTNHPPVLPPLDVTRTAGLSLKVFWSQLTNQWSDGDGDMVTLSTFNTNSTGGVTVQTNGLIILYPASAPNVADQLTYTATDGQGAIVSGVINISVNSSVTGTSSIASTNYFGSSSNVITAYGIPGYTYILERATNMAPAAWVDIYTNQAATNGVINGVDTFWDLGGSQPQSAFYQLKWQPAP
jgi:fibronectin-binding autotransporter adhesin